MLLICTTPAYAWRTAGPTPDILPEYGEEYAMICSDRIDGKVYYYLHGFGNYCFDAAGFIPAPDLTVLGIENGMMKVNV